MSSEPEESHPNEDSRSSVTIEPHENEALKGLLGKGIVAGDWSLVKDVAAVLHRIHGVPNSIDTSHIDVDDIINAARLAPPNAARFPRRDAAGLPYGRTAGDTPAGEQPYDDDPPLTPGRYGHVSRLDPRPEQPYGFRCDGYNASDQLVDLCDMCGNPRNAH